MALTGEVVRKLSHEAGMLWNPVNAWGMLAKLIYDKACEDCAMVFEDFRSDPRNKNAFYHPPTICRALKHGGKDAR